MKKTLPIIIILLIALSAGCGPAFVPQTVREQIDQNLDLAEAIKNPDQYKGKLVLWGGTIIKTINKKKGSLIEVVQLPLDSSGRPKDVDTTQGRFIIAIQQFMDPAIYAQGREISVVGEIAGVETLPLGEVTYTYALLRANTLKLWPKRPIGVKIDSMPYPPPYYMGPPSLYWYNSPYMWW